MTCNQVAFQALLSLHGLKSRIKTQDKRIETVLTETGLFGYTWIHEIQSITEGKTVNDATIKHGVGPLRVVYTEIHKCASPIKLFIFYANIMMLPYASGVYKFRLLMCFFFRCVFSAEIIVRNKFVKFNDHITTQAKNSWHKVCELTCWRVRQLNLCSMRCLPKCKNFGNTWIAVFKRHQPLRRPKTEACMTQLRKSWKESHRQRARNRERKVNVSKSYYSQQCNSKSCDTIL